MLNLNLPGYDTLIKEVDQKTCIYDRVRKKYVVLTPEEWVRQHFINFLIAYKAYPRTMIKMEYGMKYNQLGKRADILAMDNNGKPLLLVECKAPSQELDEKVVLQLSTYQSKISARYFGITNGLVHLFWKKGMNGPEKILDIPDYNQF